MTPIESLRSHHDMADDCEGPECGFCKDLQALAAKDTEIAGLKCQVDVGDNNVRIMGNLISKQEQEISVRGETIVRLEGELEDKRGKLVEQWLNDELADYRMVIDHCTKVYCHFTHDRISKPNTFPEEVIAIAEDLERERVEEAIKEAVEEKDAEIAALNAQLIEERWQKDRAEWFLEHALCSKDACGNGPNISHEKWDWTPDQWRRQAEEQLKETA